MSLTIENVISKVKKRDFSHINELDIEIILSALESELVSEEMTDEEWKFVKEGIDSGEPTSFDINDVRKKGKELLTAKG